MLHSISKVYFSHCSERMWSVNLDASISGVSDPRRAFLPAFRVTGSADDKPGGTWERRRHVWEHLESQSCIQFVFSSKYLCIYIATHISNNSSFRQKHPGVPDGSDGSDGTSHPLTENYTLPIAQATCRVA